MPIYFFRWFVVVTVTVAHFAFPAPIGLCNRWNSPGDAVFLRPTSTATWCIL